MSLIKPDYSERADLPPEDGTYRAQVTGVKERTWANGTVALSWQLDLVDAASNTGKRIWHSTPISGPFAGKLAHMLNALEGSDNAHEQSASEGFDPESYINREVEIVVLTKDDKDGVPRTNVASVKAI